MPFCTLHYRMFGPMFGHGNVREKTKYKVIKWCILSYLIPISLWEEYPLMLINMSL